MQTLFKNKFLLVILICLSLFAICFISEKNFLPNSDTTSMDITRGVSEELLDVSKNISYTQNCGDSIGSFNGVTVYLNSGGVMSCDGERNLNADGYSYGIKWQCVEFVRRYYYEHLNHKMPNRYGHASDYFKNNISSGSMNLERGLLQYRNGDIRPQKEDLLVWPGTYGHVAIVTDVTETTVSTIAQNVGGNCTDVLSLHENIIGGGCIGFLRKDE